MSRNGSGVYSLPAGNPVVTGTTISSTWANTTLSDIQNALTQSVSADGQTTITGALVGTNGTVKFGGTGQTQIPSGTTAQRSSSPFEGMIRYNTDLSTYEGYSNGTWITISKADAANIVYNEGQTNAVDTTVAAKLQETISVLDFGADPTGVASSVTAFQNAINATNTAKVEVIHVPRGTYLGNMTTLTYGTGIVVFQEEGGVTYTTASPSGEHCLRQNSNYSSDNTRPWSVGFSGMASDYVTGTNRPVLRIQKTNNATTTAAGNASALSIQNTINQTAGQLSNGAIENCLVMETDVYTNATTTATPAFGIIQGSLFKKNPSYGSYIASNFVARDETKLGNSNSFGSLVAMEVDIVASGPDTVSRVCLDVVGRGYDASADGATSMYAGCRVRPASTGVLSAEPMKLINGYKTEINSLGSIDTHFFADGPCKSTGAHFIAISDSTVQGIMNLGSQRSTVGQTVAQIGLQGWNSSNVLKNYGLVQTLIRNSTAGSESGTIQFSVQQAGTNTVEMQIGNGLTLGPVSAAAGLGTINVSGGIYLNGTAYTNPDYVFEKAYTGKIEKFANNIGADTYVSRTIEEAEQYTKDNLALPDFGQDANLDYLGGSELLLARLEEAYLYIFELNKRLKKLENK